MGRSAANRQGTVMELSGNFTLSGEWSPCMEIVGKMTSSDLGFVYDYNTVLYRKCFAAVKVYFFKSHENNTTEVCHCSWK